MAETVVGRFHSFICCGSNNFARICALLGRIGEYAVYQDWVDHPNHKLWDSLMLGRDLNSRGLRESWCHPKEGGDPKISSLSLPSLQWTVHKIVPCILIFHLHDFNTLLINCWFFLQTTHLIAMRVSCILTLLINSCGFFANHPFISYESILYASQSYWDHCSNIPLLS